ncbi:MAG: multicopper oxidase domain-containing protein [Desulfobulbaceae bacterium]|nr:multicopper oxidase domain-containing protein [Desulfobulbaceae bacterium]
MKNNYIPLGLKSFLGALGFVAIAGTCQAADVYLVAKQFNTTMPDGLSVSMWGFAEDADADLSTDGGEMASAPGPMITVAPGDSVLNIHVRNDLAEPMSLVIPGQTAGMSPVMFTDSTGRSRVRSFTHETAPGGIETYSWNAMRPGSYVYQSGTHPAVQVQMGLYGAVTKDFAAGMAYDGVSYDNDAVLLHSEIDPALHEAVVGGTYGTVDYPSTINYEPRYFLINGAPYPDAMPLYDHKPVPGETVLLRFMSAGLQTHIPTLVGPNMDVVAEDGNLYPYAREQYSVLLTAGKTIDAVMASPLQGIYSIYDRSLDLTNAMDSDGGMQTRVTINACNGDIDGDGMVDLQDFGILRSQWGQICTVDNPCSADINGDGSVDLQDFGILRVDFGRLDCLTP